MGATYNMRDQILSAAGELLRNHGPSKATARAICDAAGVKAPTLYHYFGDLDRLYREVVARGVCRVRQP